MKWTRRKFIGSSGAGPVMLSASASLVTAIAPARVSSAAVLGGQERKTLEAAMDEIIPRGDGMPSACDVGGMKYLDDVAGGEPAVAKSLGEALTALDGVSRHGKGKALDQLGHEQRIAVLKEFEKQDAVRFATLRDFVYESYYTQPQVWKLIDYEFHATDHAGPQMKPFDESVLAEVRRKPKFYREA